MLIHRLMNLSSPLVSKNWVGVILFSSKDNYRFSWKMAKDVVNLLKNNGKAESITFKGLSHHYRINLINTILLSQSDDFLLNVISDFRVIVNQSIVTKSNRVNEIVPLSKLWSDVIVNPDLGSS